jgi:hypothetical protein
MSESATTTSEIVFGGTTTTPLPVQRQASWFQVLEAAFLQLTATSEGRELYGDPNRGATLVQAWRTSQLLGSPPRVCLLATGQPRVAASGITRVISLAPADLVKALARLLSRESRSAAQIFVFDGRTGHSVTLLGTDDDGRGFTFHDPWPGDSLLSKAHNAAGVDAQRRGNLWHATADELGRVLVAAFVAPLAWAEVNGQPGRIGFTEFQATDFWSFFRVRETSRDESDPGAIVAHLRTGGFAEHLGLQVTLNEIGLITAAELRLREAWLIGPPAGVNPLATDITASFVRTVTPPVDRDQVEPIAQAIRQFRIDAANKARLEDPRFVASEPGRALQAYAGVGSDSLRLPMTGAVLSIVTQPVDNQPWRTVMVDCL